jgi:hypothetical protein
MPLLANTGNVDADVVPAVGQGDRSHGQHARTWRLGLLAVIGVVAAVAVPAGPTRRAQPDQPAAHPRGGDGWTSRRREGEGC